MAFPDSSKKAPNVFIEVFDDTGSPIVVTSSGTSYGPVIVNSPAPAPPPPSLLCSSFVYKFGTFIPITPDLPLGWPASHLWYFRVYQNPISNLDLGPATLVTIDASVVLTIADFIASVESQLPGFTCFFSDSITMVLSRTSNVFALEDGDGTEYPTPGYNYGIWDYKAFYEYTDNNSYPDSLFGSMLDLNTCFVVYQPEIRWADPQTDPNAIIAIGNPTDVTVSFPVPSCVVLVLDTFTGTGNLSTHVGEIGATWATSNALGSGWFPDGGNTIANILLNGDGTITPDTYRQPMVYPSGTVGLTDTFTIEIDFESIGTGMGPYTGFLGNLDTGEAYVLNWFAVNSYFEIDMYYLSAGGSTETLTYFSVPSLNDTGMHTLTIVCTPTIKSFYLDGIYQTEFTDSRITTGVAFLYLNDCFNGKFSRFEVNSCAIVPPQPIPVISGTEIFSTSDTSSATMNTTDIPVNMLTGQILKFGTTSLPGASHVGDTFIRLFDPSMNEVVFNDDYNGTGSYIQYTALVDGIYTMRIGCYASSACSGTVAWEVFNP
jgi:hypothetical protein